jgi:ABC-type transport system substrate-binding protein
MAQSKYDTDGDGVCDAPECKDILMVVSEASPPYPEQTALLQDNWGELGLTFNVKQFEHTTMYSKCSDPATKAAVCPSVGWLPDYFDAATVIPPLFGTEGLYPAYGNLSLLGADAAYLEEYGYDPIEIPSVDDKIEECAVIPAGDARFECWANLDRYIMEEVVNWVPLLFDTSRTITGERIVNFVHSASAGMEALDRLALAEGSA